AAITRYVGRDAFGSLAAGLAFVSIALNVGDVGLFTVATREVARRPDEERRLLANAGGLALAISGTALVVGLVGMFLLYPGADGSRTREAIAILLAQLLVAAPGGMALVYFNVRQQALPLSVATTVSSLVFLVLLGLVILLDGGFGFVVATYTVGAFVTALVPLLFARGGVPLRPRRERALWRTMLRAALPQSAVLIVGTVYFRLDLILVSVLSTGTQTALYGLGYKVIESLLWLPGLLMFTLFPEIARQDLGSGRLRELIQTAFSAIQLILLPLVVVLVGFAPEIVQIVGGGKYAGAATVLRLLAISMALGYFNVIFGLSMASLGQQWRLLRVLVASLVVKVGLNLILIPADGARGAAIALAVSEAAGVVLGLFVYRDMRVLPRIYKARETLVVLVAMVAVPVVLDVFDVAGSIGKLPVLVIGGAAVFAVYVLGLWLLRAMPADAERALRRLLGGSREPVPEATAHDAPGT
ncbi:MAG: polysaccharide biosynthesis C-terminal domain-containing protein, partial [Thermoleophilaceae bacterium]